MSLPSCFDNQQIPCSIALWSVLGEHMKQDLVGGGTQVVEYFATDDLFSLYHSAVGQKLSYLNVLFCLGSSLM